VTKSKFKLELELKLKFKPFLGIRQESLEFSKRVIADAIFFSLGISWRPTADFTITLVDHSDGFKNFASATMTQAFPEPK
jgi:hypothetical protein